MLQSYTKKCRILGKGGKMNEEDENMLKILERMAELSEVYEEIDNSSYKQNILRIRMEIEESRKEVFQNIGMETWLEKRSRLNKETK